ncbi:MAG: hypothetical protein GY694_06210 [Gammaproteobacteria bacterium]|nr:hypothetical protein [Gammaproteobacteria bacterium]
MITLLKIIGFSLLILIGYHYVNEPQGFSVAGSIATVIFSICLLSIQETYEPDGKIWVGWGLISSGCLLLATFTSFSFFLLVPVGGIIAGYKLAELPFNLSSGGGGGTSDGGSFGDFGGCDGGGD